MRMPRNGHMPSSMLGSILASVAITEQPYSRCVNGDTIK